MATASEGSGVAATLFDSHCHLDFAAFEGDREQVLQRARGAGVGELLVPGFGPRRAELAAAGSGVCIHMAQGLHPFWLDGAGPGELEEALTELRRDVAAKAPVAIGECGLDRRLSKRQGHGRAAAAAFDAQLALAVEAELPVVVHAVGAYGEVLAALQKHRPPRGGVIHAYSGSAEMVPRFAELGFYFGFGARVCDPLARRARAALAAVPWERLLLETDAPDQALAGPQVRNEPAELAAIAESIAQLLSRDPQALALQTTENARRLFRLAVTDD